MNSSEIPEKKSNSLEGLISKIDQMPDKGGAPVHLWNPDHCGELDMIIEENGSWIYNKTPIGRQKLVKLFSSVLKREGDQYFLVTPVEKIGIKVKDVPFIATSLDVNGSGENQQLYFTTNVGDTVIAGLDHPLTFIGQQLNETIKPYIHIRHDIADGLQARLSRPVYYQLANLAVEGEHDGKTCFGVWSEGVFFPLDSNTDQDEENGQGIS